MGCTARRAAVMPMKARAAWPTGEVVQFQVGTDGSITMAGFEADQDNIMGSYAARASLRTLLADGRGGALRQELVRVLQRSITADVIFRAKVMATPLPALGPVPQ